jgi:predicted metal-dependent phosphoesterase TrpH
VRIDLHTHSDRSDGTDTPAELVRHARDQGIDVLALTDHDTTEGWDEAADVAARSGITLIRGIEVSARFAGSGVHLLAYLPDPTHPGLVDELDRVLAGRNSRLPAVLERLPGSASRSRPPTSAAARPTPPRWAVRTSPTRWSPSAWWPTATRRSRATSAPAARPTSTATPPT